MHARARVSFIVSLHEHATNIFLPRLPPLPSRVHDSFTARASPAVALNCAAGSLEGFPFLDVKTRLFRAHRAGYCRESSGIVVENRGRVVIVVVVVVVAYHYVVYIVALCRSRRRSRSRRSRCRCQIVVFMF